MNEEYERHLVASLLVLWEIRNAPLTGSQLHGRLLARSRAVSVACPEFDFEKWSGAPIWEFLGLLASSNFLAAAGRWQKDSQEWSAAEIQITDRGRHFVEEIIRNISEPLKKFLVEAALLELPRPGTVPSRENPFVRDLLEAFRLRI